MKRYLGSIISISISIICFIMFAVIGSEVLENGTLKEPFFLIPIGYLFFGVSIILAVITLFKNKVNIKK